MYLFSILNVLFLLNFLVLSYKIVVFSPDLSTSQYIWNKRVSEKLSEAGHNVTLISMKFNNKNIIKSPLNKLIKTYTVNGNIKANYKKIEDEMGSLIFQDISFFNKSSTKILNFVIDNFISSCEKFITNKEFLNFIINEKFDIAFSHMFDYCTIGIIHYTKIPTWIWLSSGVLADHMSIDLGVPMPSSYVPPIRADYNDKMNFFQRTKSFIGHTIIPLFYHKILITDKETALFRKHLSPDFPDLREISKKCPLAMVNSHEFYDIPKPTLHKVINIGGLGMTKKDAKPLEGIFKKVVEDTKTKGIILFTFGSIANSTLMPYSWKISFMKAFEKFPKYKFFIRYEGNDIDNILPKNVHLSSWLPQTDLLQESKTKLIITHCGYNSFQESISAGIPMLCIPLAGDQPRNAKLAERHGLGMILLKSDVNEENIIKSLKSIINDNYYIKNTKLFKDMILKKPIPSDVLLIKWTEFLAEFKTLDNMIPYGVNLNFIEYYQIDVVLVLFILFFLTISVLFIITKKLLSIILKLFLSNNKEKND
ncbi:UDP-glucuronosyl/UDP-glucosyltransferase family-containing protein [Strongyloides ratti]|uniref:glucuronosyltransferase n=1 Tax=Strongyloides ratti TaxID=34506 RepID=A0A090N0A6_STRRB|nr:UDP-glucuronosyl/UDP-glucosyltransferase family-containing protein [Strongyloides ratti]CEF70350.1 UDP-glucuronosyl/UDP-glucosyltransferase family-containing protein [Strongyloides ratti]